MARWPSTRLAATPMSSTIDATTSSASASVARAAARTAAARSRRSPSTSAAAVAGQRVAAVGQAAGDGRGHRAGHADQGEDGDAGLRQVKLRAGQHHRRDGPEQAEGTEQAGVVGGAAAQQRRAGEQVPQRADQLARKAAASVGTRCGSRRATRAPAPPSAPRRRRTPRASCCGRPPGWRPDAPA